MNATVPRVASSTAELSAAARKRMLGIRGEPLLYADWLRVVFLHFEVDAEALQRAVPFELDLREGRAYLSLVAFTMRGMHPRLGGKLGALLLKPIATNNFLNVRAYVKHRGEPGIHFLAEWMDNPLSVHLGPVVFDLPYRLGRLEYCHRHEVGELRGSVSEISSGGRILLPLLGERARVRAGVSLKSANFVYDAKMDAQANFAPCAADSLDEFLLERYTAFTVRNSALRIPRSALFHIWHPPWPQTPVRVSLLDTSLLTETWPWFADARLVGANYSPGIRGVWMGRPQATEN